MSLFNRIANLFGAKQENETLENGLVLKKNVKVSDLKAQFNEKFGSVLRVYSGRSQVENAVTLSEAGLTTEGIFDCRGNMLVGNFTTKMMEDYGLKVKVYTCDEWVAVIDGLTLSASGIVKKNAVKADMEAMLTGDAVAPAGVTPVSEAKAGIFAVIKNSDGSYSVTIDGKYCANAKSAMRQIADALEFKYDAAWNTRQFGAKLSKYIEECAAEVQNEVVPEQPVNDEVKKAAEAAKLAAEQAKAQAEKEVAEAKAELEKAKAEAEKEAAAAKKAVEEAAKQDKAAPKASKSSNLEGALPGVFTLEDGRKIRFSKGFLQFNPKKYEFQFAEHQYEHIGSDGNENCKPNYDGWIDLFGWGTSGYMGCQPTENSMAIKSYGPEMGNLTGDNSNYDWGVYNPITNGGNKDGLWRTISSQELEYLKYKRPNAEKLLLRSCVCGKEGLMLLPDDFWNNRLPFIIDATPDKYFDNYFDQEKWKILESMGVVFFPKHRYKDVGEVEVSYYSTQKKKEWIYGCETWYTTFFWKSDRPSRDYAQKFPVRLIKDVK